MTGYGASVGELEAFPVTEAYPEEGPDSEAESVADAGSVDDGDADDGDADDGDADEVAV